MKITTCCIVLATVLAMSTSSRASERPQPATPEELGKLTIACLSTQDTNAVVDLFISLDEFKATFSGEDLEGKHARLSSVFVAGLSEAAAALNNAVFVSMDMHFVQEAFRETGIPTHAGMDFGGIAFTGETFALDNVWAKVRIADKVRDVKLDAMVKVGKVWRLLDCPGVKPEQPAK